jgi:hypothetical protein
MSIKPETKKTKKLKSLKKKEYWDNHPDKKLEMSNKRKGTGNPNFGRRYKQRIK